MPASRSHLLKPLSPSPCIVTLIFLFVLLGKEIENFFLSFGVEENESVKPSNEDETSNAVVVSEPSSSPQGKTETPVTSSNLWGNFAGSFFDLKSAASGTPAPTTTAPTASAAPYITTEDAAVSSSANVLSPPKPTVPNSEQVINSLFCIISSIINHSICTRKWRM